MAVNIEQRSADAKARAARAAEARARGLRPGEVAALVRQAANLARVNEAAPEVVQLLPSYAASFSRPLPENKPHARAFRAALPHLRSASEALRVGNSQAVAEYLSIAESFIVALLTTGGPASEPVREKESARREVALSEGLAVMRSMRAYFDIAIEMALHGWRMGGEVITIPRCHARPLIQTRRTMEREVARIEMKIAAQPEILAREQAGYGLQPAVKKIYPDAS